MFKGPFYQSIGTKGNPSFVAYMKPSQNGKKNGVRVNKVYSTYLILIDVTGELSYYQAFGQIGNEQDVNYYMEFSKNNTYIYIYQNLFICPLLIIWNYSA